MVRKHATDCAPKISPSLQSLLSLPLLDARAVVQHRRGTMVRPTRLVWLLLSAVVFSAPVLVATAPATPAISVPRFTHPGTGQTVYFLLTDRFANGSTANDQGGLSGGPDVHGFDPTRISHFHGGDFAGLKARLGYLKELGMTAVWVTPPFKNKPMQQGTAGYHGYWILDFLQIDPHLGTNEEFQEFVRQAHALGMRVYMDIIVNHTADVIGLQGDHRYRDLASAPYRDAAGQPFDERAVA
jgi:alpha-amylase